MTPQFLACAAGGMKVPFTKTWEAEGKVLLGGRPHRDKEGIFGLGQLQTSSEMSGWQLCIQVSRAEAELEM